MKRSRGTSRRWIGGRIEAVSVSCQLVERRAACDLVEVQSCSGANA